MNNDIVQTKQCTDCGETKPLTDYYPQRKGVYTSPKTVTTRCRPCFRKTYTYEYREAIRKSGRTATENRRLGGIAARDRNLKRDPDFYKRIGKIGGSVNSPRKGFGSQATHLVSEAGRLGGSRSKRRGLV